jgi:hypothetical protein
MAAVTQLNSLNLATLTPLASSYAYGSVTVALLFAEGNGTYEPSEKDWTEESLKASIQSAQAYLNDLREHYDTDPP